MVILGACFDPPEFGDAPQIDFKSIYFRDAKTVGQKDSLVFTISFKDGRQRIKGHQSSGQTANLAGWIEHSTEEHPNGENKLEQVFDVTIEQVCHGQHEADAEREQDVHQQHPWQCQQGGCWHHLVVDHHRDQHR